MSVRVRVCVRTLLIRNEHFTWLNVYSHNCENLGVEAPIERTEKCLKRLTNWLYLKRK